MPTPVGHALAGVAVGWAVDGPRRPLDRAAFTTAAAYGLVAAMPDLDLLLPTHRGPTHGIGSAVLAGMAAWGLTGRARAGLAFALAFASHILLDWLGTDTSPPIGVMALWPFSREYYESPYHVFMAVSRRYWLPEFWTYNFRVLLRELLILTPMVILAGALRRRRGAALLVALGVLFCASSRVGAQPSFTYAEAIESYRTGKLERAIGAVLQLEHSVVRQQADELRRASERTGLSPRLQPAITLHTEAFQYTSRVRP